MVSIAGGEPLMHPQIDEMVNELVKRKKYVYLCTNAELVRKRFDKFDFKPSHYFSFAIHIDGLRERHDESVAKEGVFDEADRGDQVPEGKGLPGHDQLDLLQHRHPADDHRRAELPQRRGQGRPDDDLAGLRLREGARPGSLPRRHRDPRAVHARRSPAATASAGGSTTRRCSSTSSRARSTSSAPRGASRPTRCWAGRSRAT